MQSLWALLHLGRNAVKRHLERTTTAAGLAPPLEPTSSIPGYRCPGPSCRRARPDWHPGWAPRACPPMPLAAHRSQRSRNVITDVFDAFVGHTLSESRRPSRGQQRSPLARVCVVQTATTRARPSVRPSRPTWVYWSRRASSRCAAISAYPRWRLREVFLEDIGLSYHSHFRLFVRTTAARLVLHRIGIPGGTPYVRRVVHQGGSSVVALVVSELRCLGPDSEGEEKQVRYSTFFALSLCPNLQELELAGLDEQAFAGLLAFLRPPPVLVFWELRKLIHYTRDGYL
ncbi:hypothetical protein BJ912DRAFT_1060054 [Pholiota molesta]|nr:hypothetical protein BJ912DRAFT_1060054 [Pholiota molesta]